MTMRRGRTVFAVAVALAMLSQHVSASQQESGSRGQAEGGGESAFGNPATQEQAGGQGQGSASGQQMPGESGSGIPRNPNLLYQLDPRDKYEVYQDLMNQRHQGNNGGYILDPTAPGYMSQLERQRLELEMQYLRNQLQNQYSIENQMANELPLPPDQIIDYRRQREDVERARNVPLVNVEEEYRTENLDMQQNKPIRINIVPGYLSTLTFFDATGQPWPIEYAQPGNDSFQMSVAGEQGNVININTSSGYTSANASIGLAGMNTNLTITLNANQSTNTSKLEFRIPERGPNASQEAVKTSGTVENAPDEMFDVLNGRLYNLEGAQTLDVNGVDARAYLYNDFMYVVSKHHLRSPARENAVSLPSGMNAYKIYPTSTLQFSVDGESIFANVERR